MSNDLKVLISFIHSSPKNRWGENTYLNRLDALVRTFDEGAVDDKIQFAPLQIQLVGAIHKAFGWDKRFWVRTALEKVPQFIARRTAAFVKKYITELTIAYYNPWRYRNYYPVQPVSPVFAQTPSVDPAKDKVELSDLSGKFKEEKRKSLLSRLKSLEERVARLRSRVRL